MKVYLTSENKTQSIVKVPISAWEKIYLLKKWFPKLNDLDKTKSQRKEPSVLFI